MQTYRKTDASDHAHRFQLRINDSFESVNAALMFHKGTGLGPVKKRFRE
jgi:hypothetical protein